MWRDRGRGAEGGVGVGGGGGGVREKGREGKEAAGNKIASQLWNSPPAHLAGPPPLIPSIFQLDKLALRLPLGGARAQTKHHFLAQTHTRNLTSPSSSIHCIVTQIRRQDFTKIPTTFNFSSIEPTGNMNLFIYYENVAEKYTSAPILFICLMKFMSFSCDFNIFVYYLFVSTWFCAAFGCWTPVNVGPNMFGGL